MKKTICAAFLLAITLVLFGCFQPPVQGDDLSGFKDCGKDRECITQHFKFCEKAFATLTEQNFGVTMDIKVFIYGLEAEQCKTKYVFEKIIVDPNSSDAAQNQIIAAMLQGKDMTCLITKEQMQNSDAMVMGMNPQEQCTGSFVDTLKQMGMASGVQAAK